MTDLLVPDVMADLQTYLQGHPLLADLTGPRVWFRIQGSPTAAPFIRLYQVGGGMLAGEVPVENPRISHEIWGLANPDYVKVRQTVRALKTIYQSAQNVLMGSTVLQNAEVTGTVDSPDPDTGIPRVVLDVVLIAVPA